MGWNRSNGHAKDKAELKYKGKFYKSLSVVLVLSVGILLAVRVLFPDKSTSKPIKRENSSSMIHDVSSNKFTRLDKPTDTIKKVTHSALEAKELSKRDEHGFPQLVTDEFGKMWYRGVEVPKESPGTVRRKGKIVGRRQFFKSGADNYLCALFLTGTITGRSHAARELSDKFYSDMEKSLSEKVTIEDSDDDETRDVKHAMQAVKDNLAKRIANGEKIKDIIEHESEMRQKVIKARENYQTMLKDLANKQETTAKDIEDFINAANSILKENNSMPLHVPPSISFQLQKLKKGNVNE